MASLVTEILNCAGKLEEQEIGNKLDCLNEKIEMLKIDLLEYVEKKYVDFVPVSLKTSEMCNRLSVFEEEMQSLSYSFRDELSRKIEESADEFQEIRTQLVTAKSALEVVKQLISINDALLRSQTCFKEQLFEDSVTCLESVHVSVKQLQDTWKDQIKILSSLNEEYHIQKEKLKYDMGEIWKNWISWTVNERTDGAEQTNTAGNASKTDNFTQLSIQNPTTINFKNLVRAMHRVQYLQQNMQLFGKRLMKYVILPIITSKTQISVLTEGEKSTLKLNISHFTSSQQRHNKPEVVFDNLMIVFEFLIEHKFQNLTVCSDDENDEQSLIQLLGNIIYEEFRDTLIKECLAPAVPSKRQDLEAFDKIVCQTTNFHNNLSSIGILPPDEKTLISYAQDVDSLFINKVCQTLLADARKLMLTELHKSIKVGGGGPEIELVDTSATQRSIQDTVHDDKQTRNMFTFPVCEISKSAKDLVDKLHSMMEDAVSSSPQCAVRLIMTARSILTIYCDISTCYHKDSLETMPLHSALFQNNCMYIAHHTMIMGQKFNSRLPSPLNDDIVTFVDFVPGLREGGMAVFLAQMRTQRKHLLEFLRQAGDFRNLATDEQFIVKMEKAVKQCLLQLENLSKMWKNVLSSNVYLKALGTLLNTVLEEIITQVTIVEDLSATHATQIIQIFEDITTRSQALFLIDELQVAMIQIQRAVPKWLKFTELILVLNSSLQNIVDRWASGKGLLAQEFSADEVKQLIRALFQNTDRRAAVLSKIR